MARFHPFFVESYDQMRDGDHVRIAQVDEATGWVKRYEGWLILDEYGGSFRFTNDAEGISWDVADVGQIYILGRNWHKYPKESNGT